jgi:peptide deformylase
MAVRPIVLIGDPVLRQKARRVRVFGERLRRLAEDMVETMREAPGVGLAAPQIGVSERLIVVEIPQDEGDPQSGKLYIVANPEIVKAGHEEEEGTEGCLSIPGYVGDVKRAIRVTIKGQDVDGRAMRIKAHGYLARVFQHEIDHLDGILFIDRVESPDKIRKVEAKEEARTPQAIPVV